MTTQCGFSIRTDFPCKTIIMNNKFICDECLKVTKMIRKNRRYKEKKYSLMLYSFISSNKFLPSL